MLAGAAQKLGAILREGTYAAISGGGDKPRLRASEHDACQPPGGKCPGVDVDAIGQYLRPLGRSMPVNDDLAEIGGAAQKLVPDPQQVLDALAVQWNSRPHARVTHEIFVDRDGCFQRREKCEVLVGHRGAKRRCRIRVVLADHQDRKSVVEERVANSVDASAASKQPVE